MDEDRRWDKTDWKARAERLATLLDGFREDARRFRHLMSLAEPHADGWRIELPGDMPFEQAIDTDMQTRAVITGLQRSARGDHNANEEKAPGHQAPAAPRTGRPPANNTRKATGMNPSDRVLYTYHCECGHRGQVHYEDDSYAGAVDRCEFCDGVVRLEWDGGVTMAPNHAPGSRPHNG